MRFLCDHMLIRLGRWLRAAGYDTAIAEGRSGDRALLDWAVRDDRLLLTRDHKLIELRGARGRVLLLPAQGVEAAAAALTALLHTSDRFGGWLWRPFTRCLVDNAVLVEAAAEDHAAIPEASRPVATTVLRCPACARLYWDGGHTRRMRATLDRWQAGRFAAPERHPRSSSATPLR